MSISTEGTPSRLAATFEGLRRNGTRALVTFLTGGDPDIASLPGLMEALCQGGADVIEVGVPFSDPVADGVVIQRSIQRALKNHTGIPEILAVIKGFRQTRQTPVVLFGYTNPFLQYGLAKLARDASMAGVDGFRVVDLPLEESDTFRAELDPYGLDLILAVSPNTALPRMKGIIDRSSGFVFYVSQTGVTGADPGDVMEVNARLEIIKRYTSTPVCVGFGISNPGDVRTLGALADGVVVGSAIVWLIEGGGRDVGERVQAFVAELKETLVSMPA